MKHLQPLHRPQPTQAAIAPHSPVLLLAALGLLACCPPAFAQAVDTSKWKCSACPYPTKGTTGELQAGLGTVTEASSRFGDVTGLDRKRAHAVLGGSATHHDSEAGYHAQVQASDLGLDSRSLQASAEREGLYRLSLGYDQLPRHLASGAASPFLGIGSGELSLPAGYPAGDTRLMPLASTLQSVSPGYQRKRTDLRGTLYGGQHWTYGVSLRRDTREGTKPLYGAFFSTASQLLAPVDHQTDQLEVSAAYTTRQVQASLGWQLSRFSNGQPSLTWANPFLPVGSGATRGRIALAPDNDAQQVFATLGWNITPTIRASADVAVGRLEQNSAFVESTLNPALAARVPALPSTSLGGRVDTFNAGARVTANPLDDLRVTASFSRDQRNNRSPILSWPQVTADVYFRDPNRSNTPFDLLQDRYKLHADYRGLEPFRLSAGIERDQRTRDYHEAVRTRETTVWGRAGVQPTETMTLSLKLARAQRSHSPYGTAVWFGQPENPLLRKLNLSARERQTVGARMDLAISETVQLGVSLDHHQDEHKDTAVGLTAVRSGSVGVDLSAELSEHTRVTAYVQGESQQSRQAGSQLGRVVDWTARNQDRFHVLGVNLKHALIPDKLDLSAELSMVRTNGDVTVDTGVMQPLFPANTSARDSLKLGASYKLSDAMSLEGTLWHERYSAQDWQLDGVTPAAVYDLLSLGATTGPYKLNMLSVAVRWRF